jgi:hypothetical protein
MSTLFVATGNVYDSRLLLLRIETAQGAEALPALCPRLSSNGWPTTATSSASHPRAPSSKG